MKTLIFNGSPRPKGDTACLIEVLKQSLPGEITEIRAYREMVKPCVDCRYCWTHPGCSIRDGMQDIYRAIEEADCIVVASPVYFSGLTGALLAMMSRLQMFYTARRFQQTERISKAKAGGILLTGGGEGSPRHAESTARMLLRGMRVTGTIPLVASLDTDHKPARDDTVAQSAVQDMAAELVRRVEDLKTAP